MREATFIEDWLEEKLGEGFQQGLQQTRLADVQQIVRWRFGVVPLSLAEQLGRLTAEQLEPLEAFTATVDRLLTRSRSDGGTAVTQGDEETGNDE